jgi:hypothetical protein
MVSGYLCHVVAIPKYQKEKPTRHRREAWQPVRLKPDFTFSQKLRNGYIPRNHIVTRKIRLRNTPCPASPETKNKKPPSRAAALARSAKSQRANLANLANEPTSQRAKEPTNY